MGLIKNKYELGKLEVAFIIIILLALVVAGLFAWKIGRDKNGKISTFAECVEAGNEVLDSYPEQCQTGGQTYYNITNFEQCKAAGNPIQESYPERCSANGQNWTNPAQQALSDADGELSINELGVKFAPTEQLAGLYYYVNPENPNTAYFSLEEFQGTECAADKTSLAAISKYSNAQIESDEILAARKDSMKQIGDNYYLAEGAQASCSEDETVQAKASAARAELLRILPSSLQSV